MSKNIIKALSVRQPWASLIASGEKTIETRTWPTKYRGKLLVVAGKTPFKGDPALPRGVALCVADLVDCRPMLKKDERAACCEIYDGAWAWVLADITPISPFPVIGRLGLFEASFHQHTCCRPASARR
ncbi:MAG: ASCH domain-containing protein [Deltaproteobacteria bacterium]|nr:ASCH domain-containing protein [Deltaproteobacteria bacterium]